MTNTYFKLLAIHVSQRNKQSKQTNGLLAIGRTISWTESDQAKQYFKGYVPFVHCCEVEHVTSKKACKTKMDGQPKE